ncbi:hypothetical protein [Rhizobium leguminosarum]|uniref:hypothetical protein n=1 Tax=Rhizobium leguminosarum TaxID=384 RepID=UPI0014419253|nr:hypothetical protein [Rhizobium leguminosarum]NKK63231.1 hypothetical protein [Rhizobium leguminosarum bv. viciae]NKL10340.1 hypothetical protein [Rhizobium leguminosarum bv. viciae]NKL88336.1 hypothetical protein [Rhizobium leguminosarum bv. viciae]NKL95038.1 hypothetical protein [Rhizobium leguminosarum bv. viciae]NKM96472.1 hypothetical protein [Rhizobium leguminosarum bv. viciae]
MTVMDALPRRRGWHDLWLAITGRQRRGEPEAAVEVALRDTDLAAFGGQMTYGLEAERRRQPLATPFASYPAG